MALEVFAYLLAVHPHGRGDNREMPDAPCSSYGSPPRAWGQLVGFSACRRRGRFTPTGVGTMARLVARRMALPVHPHGRGDNGSMSIPAARRCGSPPRAWGQSPVHNRPEPILRFTPTGVGTITCAPSTAPPLAVHPHGRGDNDDARRLTRDMIGSPPRAWGQSVRPRQCSPNYRFTPTGVGTIIPKVDKHAVHTVHPHGRGDNYSLYLVRVRPLGSPPRAWGQC